MRITFFLLLSLCLSSCFLFKDYKRREFVYSRNGQSVSQTIIVPKGFKKEQTSDTAGVRLYTFQYPNGALLYAAYLADTTYELQPFNKAIHQPKPIGANGFAFKGQDSTNLFYREIRQGNIRYGYCNVPSASETLFDSATNYAAWQR